MEMLRTHNTARKCYFMNNNTDSDECFYCHQNFDTEGYNGTNKPFREIAYFSKKLKPTAV